MHLVIAAVGQKMPRWVDAGVTEYQRRMPAHLKLKINEVTLPKRSRNADKQKLLNTEAAALSAALPDRCLRIAMDMGGRQWSTADLAGRLLDWQQDGRAVGIMIGGPDGLDQDLIASADLVWSLGPLTLPHPVVRLILAEQIYRAWTITTGHPYHRD
jgi:23S rRNA (pseudouridine1915-N3)-methyltransferase